MIKMKVLALDQATRTGWCVGGSDLPFREWQFGNFVAPPRDELGERLLVVYDTVRRLIDRHHPDLVAHELPYDPTHQAVEDMKKGKEPRGNYSRSTMNFLQHVLAAVQMAAARSRTPTEAYAPQAWYSTLKLPETPKIFLAKDGLTPLDGDALILARKKWRKRIVFNRALAFGAPVQTEDEGDAFGICLHALHGKPASERAQLDLLADARL
jgi:Holliday junction resolvasome RuvABC endonuclease subunit